MPESSIAEEISRISGCRNDILSAISAKGVTVPEGSVLSSCPSLIASIQTGGGGGDPTASINSAFSATGHFAYTCPFTATQKEIPVIEEFTSYSTGIYPAWSSGLPLYVGRWGDFKSATGLWFTGLVSASQTLPVGPSGTTGVVRFFNNKQASWNDPSASATIRWEFTADETSRSIALATAYMSIHVSSIQWMSDWQTYSMSDYDDIYIYLYMDPYGHSTRIMGYTGDSSDPLYSSCPGPEYMPAWTYTAENGSVTHPFPEYDVTTTGYMSADYSGMQNWEGDGAGYRLRHFASGSYGAVYSSGPSDSFYRTTVDFDVVEGALKSAVSACGPTGNVSVFYDYTFGTPTSGYTGYTGI